MNLIAKLLFLIIVTLVCYPAYSISQKSIVSTHNHNAYKVIESDIYKSASALNISQPSITWSKSDTGAVATIEYKSNKVQIPFNLEEMNSADQGHITPKTKNRINKFLITLPGGGGPLP